MKIERLLLVEDHADNLALLTVMLSEKYNVFGYGSPAEALMAIEAVKPHLLVLDIGMSPVSGLQCLESIRAMFGYSSIPAIALTGFTRDVERKAFLAAGFQAVVTKPILDQGDLEAVIDKLLKSRAPSQDAPLTHSGRSVA